MKPFLSLLSILVLGGYPALASGHRHVVTMKSISFEPKVLEIPVGDSVAWENRSYTDHSATDDNAGGFDTGLVKPKHASRLISFSVPGEFSYKCRIHGKTMSGVIQVRPIHP
jgi:plastocyanin